ncbi:hypothetical protein BK844_001998 [Escherichia coli]|nr:hypothetical protein [Escherichia coli]
MKLNIILCALLLTISLQAMVVIRAYRSGQESTRYEALEKAVKESNTTVRELLKATAETQSALADIRREDQERAARGEERRETMRKNLQADECARTSPPADVADSLQQHASAAENRRHLRERAGKSDQTDAGTGAAATHDMG